jgi:hypothetical protein
MQACYYRNGAEARPGDVVIYRELDGQTVALVVEIYETHVGTAGIIPLCCATLDQPETIAAVQKSNPPLAMAVNAAKCDFLCRLAEDRDLTPQ